MQFQMLNSEGRKLAGDYCREARNDPHTEL